MAETFGASFTIDVTQLKAGLNTANKLIKESQTNFQKAAAGLDNWSKSQTGIEAKIKSLNQIIPLQEKKVDALKKSYQKLVDDGLVETSDRAIELRTQINREEAALESNRTELRKQTAALEELEKSSDDAGDSIEETGDEAKDTSGKFTVLKGALANLVAEGFRMAINAAKDFTKELVNVGMTFDDSMAQVAAVSGATESDLEKLRDKAKEMGSATKFTASEAADAFNYMAMAGWKTEEMLGGIDGILNLAAASGADLATTSDIVTDALTAMGYSAKDAGRLADVMAAASSNANTNVEMMGATFQYAAPIVGALGYSMEDTAVAIGLMANAGIKGDKAGTALRSVLTRLSAPPAECATAMEELGLSITDTGGQMKSLDTIIQEMRQAFNGLNETEQTAYAKHIAGAEAMSGLLAIVNAAPADFAKLTKAVEDSEGAAKKMADTMIDTLGGDMTILNSQLDGVRLTIYEHLSPTLRNLVIDAQKWLSSVDWAGFGKKAGDALKTIIEYAKRFAKNVLPTVKAALKVVGGALKFVIDNFNWLSKTVLIAVTAFKAFKAVMAVTTAITAAKTAIAGLTAGVGLATKAQTAWNAAMAANPIGAVITAVALLAGGIAMLVNTQRKEIDVNDLLTESQKKAIDAIHESAEAYRDNMNAANEMAAANIANVEYVEKMLLPQLKNIVDANGKVKEGEEARAQFILNQLNDALGTEYDSLEKIVGANGEIEESIYKVIEAKKAQFLLEAYEDEYKNALKAVGEEETKRAEAAQRMAAAQADLNQAYAEYQTANEQYEANAVRYGAIIGDVIELITDEREEAQTNWEEKYKIFEAEKEAYETSKNTIQSYYDLINSYDTASQAIIEGNTQKTIDTLGKYTTGFKTRASVAQESAEEQQRILGQQVVDTEINLRLMEDEYARASENMTAEEKTQAEARLNNAREQAEAAKAEFYAVGGNIVKGMASGVDGSSWVLDDAMTSLIDDAVNAAKKAADSHSPSRRFRKEIGRMLGLGVALGIKDTTKNIVKSVKNQVNAIHSAYDLEGFAPSVKAGLNAESGGGNVNNSKTVTVNQYNTYSQAHSRYELYKSKQQTAAAVRLALAEV